MNAICQHILSLYKTEPEFVNKTKLFVFGPKNVGKTTLIESVFSLKDWFKVGKASKKQYFHLQGKALQIFTDSEIKTIELDEKWIIERKNHELGIILKPLERGKRALEFYCETKEIHNLWLTRLENAKNIQYNSGIQLSQFQVSLSSTQKFQQSNLDVITWDFSGKQNFSDYYHHFFTLNSILVLVWKISETEYEGEVQDETIKGIKGLETWFKALSSHLPQTPFDSNGRPIFSIFIVGTHLDDNVNKQEGDSRKSKVLQMANQFGVNYPLQYFEVGSNPVENIEELREAIISEAQFHNYMNKEIPVSYSVIEKAISDLKVAFSQFPIIQVDELLEYCQSISSFEFDMGFLKEALTLFHDWGTCFYFGKLKDLSHLVFLNPKFLLDDIFLELFTNETPQKFLPHSELEVIWPTLTSYYPTIISFLEGFQISIRLRDKTGNLKETFNQQQSLFPCKIFGPKLNNSDSETQERFKESWPKEPEDGQIQLERNYQLNVLPLEFIAQLLVNIRFKLHQGIISKEGILFLEENISQGLLRFNFAEKTLNISIRGTQDDRQLIATKLDSLCQKIETISTTYSGLRLIQIIRSPFSETSFLTLNDIIKRDQGKPLLCPGTGFQINLQELSFETGLVLN